MKSTTVPSGPDRDALEAATASRAATRAAAARAIASADEAWAATITRLYRCRRYTLAAIGEVVGVGYRTVHATVTAYEAAHD